MSSYTIDNHVIQSDVSDHYSTLTKVKGLNRKNKHEEIFRRKSKLSENEWTAFNNELNTILSENSALSKEIGPNRFASFIVETYQTLIDKYMPLTKLTRKETRYNNKPWITKAIKNSIAKKDKLHSIAKKSGTPQKWEEFKKYRNLIKSNTALVLPRGNNRF